MSVSVETDISASEDRLNHSTGFKSSCSLHVGRSAGHGIEFNGPSDSYIIINFA